MHREAAYARRALESGADGFVLKHAAADELIAAIRAAAGGKVGASPSPSSHSTENGATLTVRQREIVQLIVKGLTAKEIASVLGLSVRTIEFHKYRAMEALGIKSTAELVRYAIEKEIAKP